ncbi:hypothetical protein C1752_04447 [Acaryochloris thomasi RCC1774]|uniref:Sulfotransferase n=1 Tax=Acaryochloris thomasi RCC1774 TaxID=1764569 RepID=A0A2W1JLG6_9CYAN|nr:sulfotransferase [Acaryochloris thomasi]PZD71752.1 hypothetical protein C1752_04447 [Acaryochloris thomasi RCC1774]
MKQHPIFIVGAPRSGTTLLSALLSSHSRIACGPESHFFNKLASKEIDDAIQDDNWPNKAVSLLTSTKLSGQCVYELFGLKSDDIRVYLTNRSPSLRVLLEALTVQHAHKLDKVRWAEKTPNHLLCLPLIRSTFPGSPIIRIIRDPRDSAMSMRKLPWASQSILANCYLWDAWFSSSHEFCVRDEETLTIRYEDLILSPKTVLSKICCHIGESFEENMLDTSETARIVSSPNEFWKTQVADPLDLDRLYVWKRELPKQLLKPTTYACQYGIETFQYEQASPPKSLYFLYCLDRDFIEMNEASIIESSNNGMEFIQVQKIKVLEHTDLGAGTFFVCKLPDLEDEFLEKVLSLLKFFLYLLINRMRGHSIACPEDYLDLRKAKGLSNFWRIFFLKILGSKAASI